jgi:hypothetical protein
MSDIPKQGTAAYFRFRCDEARATAERMQDPALRATVLNVADGYAWLAAFAERREAVKDAASPSRWRDASLLLLNDPALTAIGDAVPRLLME